MAHHRAARFPGKALTMALEGIIFTYVSVLMAAITGIAALC